MLGRKDDDFTHGRRGHTGKKGKRSGEEKDDQRKREKGKGALIFVWGNLLKWVDNSSTQG